jgi:hypothetical protein
VIANPVVNNIGSLDALAERAARTAMAACDPNVEKVALLGPQTETVCFGILNTLAVLHDMGITDEDLMPLFRAQKRLSAALEITKPASLKGKTIARYGIVVMRDAEGDPCQLFQAASIFCQANVHFKKAADTLEEAQVTIAEAQALALALFKSLEEPDPVDTDDAYDVDLPNEDLSAARYHLRGRTSKFFGRVA